MDWSSPIENEGMSLMRPMSMTQASWEASVELSMLVIGANGCGRESMIVPVSQKLAIDSCSRKLPGIAVTIPFRGVPEEGKSQMSPALEQMSAKSCMSATDSAMTGTSLCPSSLRQLPLRDKYGLELRLVTHEIEVAPAEDGKDEHSS